MNRYETLRSFRGVFALLPEHASRFDKPELCQVLDRFMMEKDACVKVIDDGGSLSIESWPLPAWNGSFLWPDQWAYKIYHGSRENAQVKYLRTAQLEQARQDAKIDGFDELLLVNKQGLLCEGSISNVFLVKGPRLVTPMEGCLPGIGRSLILKAAADLGLCVDLRDVQVSELEEADALFFVNSVRGVVLAEGSECLPIVKQVVDWCSQFIQNRIDEANAVHGHSESHSG